MVSLTPGAWGPLRPLRFLLRPEPQWPIGSQASSQSKAPWYLCLFHQSLVGRTGPRDRPGQQTRLLWCHKRIPALPICPQLRVTTAGAGARRRDILFTRRKRRCDFFPFSKRSPSGFADLFSGSSKGAVLGTTTSTARQ